MEADSLQTKTPSLSVASDIRCMGQMEGAGPKSKSAPSPNVRPILLEFHEFKFHEIFRIVRALVPLSNAVNKSKFCRQSSKQK